MLEISEETVGKIKEALKQVIDPEIGANVVDMGLIKDIKVEMGKVTILMTLTVPAAFCPLAGYLLNQVRDVVRKVEGVREVEVKLKEYEMSRRIEDL